MKRKDFKVGNMLKAFSCVAVGTILSYANVSYGDDVGGSGSVDATCTLGTIDGFIIPEIDVGDLGVNSKSETFNIPVTCTNGTTYELSFDNGDYPENNQPRLLRTGGTSTEANDVLEYNIKIGGTTYTGAAVNTVYGGTATSGAPTNITFTAETENVPADIKIGAYADNLVVTLTVTN